MTVSNDVPYGTIEGRIEFPTFKLVASIIAIYLTFVFQIGPRLMKNRPAFKLQHFMSFYNVAQVASCLYINYLIWTLTSSTLFDFNKCVHYISSTPEHKQYEDITYYTFLLKVFELTDTVIFVLRKKQNQISYLHVFHHSSTITLVYFIARSFPCSGILYPIFLNSWIHVIMYTYYFFANICSAEVMKKYVVIKKSITIMQMIQFCIILYQAAAMWTICKISSSIKAYYCVIVLVIFYGFYDFYKKSYLNNQANKLKNNAK